MTSKVGNFNHSLNQFCDWHLRGPYLAILMPKKSYSGLFLSFLELFMKSWGFLFGLKRLTLAFIFKKKDHYDLGNRVFDQNWNHFWFSEGPLWPSSGSKNLILDFFKVMFELFRNCLGIFFGPTRPIFGPAGMDSAVFCSAALAWTRQKLAELDCSIFFPGDNFWFARVIFLKVPVTLVKCPWHLSKKCLWQTSKWKDFTNQGL